MDEVSAQFRIAICQAREVQLLHSHRPSYVLAHDHDRTVSAHLSSRQLNKAQPGSAYTRIIMMHYDDVISNSIKPDFGSPEQVGPSGIRILLSLIEC